MKNYDLSNLKVLLVEKQSLMRRLMRDVLNNLGVDYIEEATGLGEAYDLFVASSPDLIITDWAPLLDGIKFIQKVRDSENSPNPFTPVIVVTAYSEMKHVCTARDAGMTEYLCKPISAKMVYLRICSVIDKERMFIRSRKFFGPDRRRRRGDFDGPDKRSHANHRESERRKAVVPFDGKERRQGLAGFQEFDKRRDLRH